MSAPVRGTRFGFIYGPAHVERIGEGPKGHVAIYVTGGKGQSIEVHVSPGGRSVRVFDRDGVELSPNPRSVPTITRVSKPGGGS